MRDLIRLVLLCSSVHVCACSAGALVVQGEDMEKSRFSPSDALGWQFVGPRGSVTAIYIGHGWVLTAHHVPPGDVVLEGITYSAVPESAIRLKDPNGGTEQPDLAVFRIHPMPRMEGPKIRASAPKAGEPVVLVGCGRDRGPAITWRGFSGYSLTSKRTKRWGMNHIEKAGGDYSTPNASTRAFSMRFDPFDTSYEAQAAAGDSGGAVFTKRAAGWELAGVLFSITMYADQPEGSSLYGNRSIAVDLSYYREQLLGLIRSDGTANQRTSDASLGDAISLGSDAKKGRSAVPPK